MPRPIWILAAALAVATPTVAIAADAPPPDTSPSTPATVADDPAPDTPRASVRAFAALASDGRWDEAAAWLEVPPALAPRAAVLARRLRLVLEAHVVVDLATLAAVPEGKVDDGLPPTIDELATIPGPGGPEPLRLHRTADGGRWLFSRPTVARIDAWYERLPHRWVLDRLPTPLVRVGWGGLMWWQWLGMPALIAIAWLAGALTSRVVRRVAARVVKRTPTHADDRLVDRIGPPLTLALTAVALSVLARPLGLSRVAAGSFDQARGLALLLAAFWALARSVDVARDLLTETPWARATPASRTLLPLAAKAGKVTVVCVGVIAFVSRLGYPVTSIIAGLGIGGLAVALAAQKTVENIFGAVAIGIDQPFRIGDLVKIDGVTGNVEQLGLRSTRIRTAERTIVTIPNGVLNNQRIESLAARERFRLAAVVTLGYGASAAQVRAVRNGLDELLRQEPTLWPDDNLVRVRALGVDGVELEVGASFATQEYGDFVVVREKLLLEMLELIERAGATLAYPTRTVHLVGDADGVKGRPAPAQRR